jgi:hypothetical protein
MTETILNKNPAKSADLGEEALMNVYYGDELERYKAVADITTDRLSEICAAERDGRLVVLPCKVGTRVWVIGQNCDLCRDMYAEEPCLFGSCEYKEVFESVFGYGMIDNFGKTVFLTRAEAEAALQKEAQHE